MIKYVWKFEGGKKIRLKGGKIRILCKNDLSVKRSKA